MRALGSKDLRVDGRDGIEEPERFSRSSAATARRKVPNGTIAKKRQTPTYSRPATQLVLLNRLHVTVARAEFDALVKVDHTLVDMCTPGQHTILCTVRAARISADEP